MAAASDDPDRKEVRMKVQVTDAIDKIKAPEDQKKDKWTGNIRPSCFHTNLLLRTYACNSPPTSAAAAASPRTYVPTCIFLAWSRPTRSTYSGGGTSLVSRRAGLGTPHRSTYVRSWYQLLTYVHMWLPHRKFIVHIVMFGHAYVRTYVFRVLRFSYMFLKQAGA